MHDILTVRLMVKHILMVKVMIRARQLVEEVLKANVERLSDHLVLLDLI